MVEAISNQTELLKAVLNKPTAPRSTIRVEPKVYWPKLGDDGAGGREVEEFYDKFYGQGMRDKEMLVTLKTCLHGTRRKSYENVSEAIKTRADTEEGQGKIYRDINNRLFRYLEPPREE